MTSRGVRNNNPGNIKISATKWQGKVTPSNDPVFETFQTPEYGVRALAKIILSDSVQGINTIHKIIGRYAPAGDFNDTEAYEKAVCEHIQVNADDVLDVDHYDTMYALVGAIILHENGSIPYSDAIINRGLTMAGIYNVPQRTTMQRPETKAAVGIGAATTIAAAGNAVQALSPAIPLVQQLIAAAPWIAGVIAIGVIGFLIYIVYKKHTTGVY